MFGLDFVLVNFVLYKKRPDERDQFYCLVNMFVSSFGDLWKGLVLQIS